MTLNAKTELGRTGLRVGRLGISSSFGAPCAAFEEAFERGCNYFTWGTFIKGRMPEMTKAMRNIIDKGQRDGLVIAMYSYAHQAFLTEKYYLKGLHELGIDHADVLILGYFSKRPNPSIIDGALRLKEKGLVRHIALSGHNRKLFAAVAQDGVIDIFHLRYNAAHRGAENDIFPFLGKENKPGIVSFTATRWRQLLNAKKMPPGEIPIKAADCYRFVLSNPNVDVCMMGTKNLEQMRENLQVLDMPHMSEEELTRMRRIGDYIHG